MCAYSSRGVLFVFNFDCTLDRRQVIYSDATRIHDDVITWKHFPRYWPFVRGIHRSRWIPHSKASDAGLWCFFYLRLNNGCVNNRKAGVLRRYRAHCDVIVMWNLGVCTDWMPAHKPTELPWINQNFNPLPATFLRGNINLYLHFVLFPHIYTTQVVEILPQIRQEPTYST